MPLIVTPVRLAQWGELYHQIGAMLAAGLPLASVVNQLHSAPPSRHFRQPLAQIAASLKSGLAFTEAVAQIPDWLPAFDAALLRAGEQSGRLDTCCRLLATYYQNRAQLARQVLSNLAYPVFLVHFAVFIIPFPQAFLRGNWNSYLQQTFGMLIPGWLGGWLLAYLCQGRRGEFWRTLIERLTDPVPILGLARRRLALSRLVAALEALLNAGVNIQEAWELAAAASGSPRLVKEVRTWGPKLAAGLTPADILRGSRMFEELFVNLYCTGEISGTLDDALRRLQVYYEERAASALRHLAEWTPRLAYFAICLLLAFRILSWWGAYYSGILGN
jgi:protein transport protein HofC